MTQFTPPPKSEAQYKPVPVGNHVARCFQIVDLGTQTSTFEGETKQARKVRFVWELPNELKEFNGKQEPCAIGRTVTLSLHKKSTLRPLIESWLGRKLSEEEIDSGAWKLSDLLGMTCLLNVTNTEKDGKTYANVQAVTPVPKGMVVPEAVNPTTWFFCGYNGLMEDFDTDVFMKLPDWMQQLIMSSPEYSKSHGFVDSKTKESTPFA